ncbi:uncharacterized protein PG998_005239 [Apiospora kogelbergensis]|uniref:uncharacterized protein n=1 Tax=Apiospora kogelbergensis TaxID=1337665 RepID=UPI00312D2EDF
MSRPKDNKRLYTPRPSRVGGRVVDNGAGNEVVTVPSVVILSGGNGSSTDLLQSAAPPPARAPSAASKVSSSSLTDSVGPSSTRQASHHRNISLQASLGSISGAEDADRDTTSNGARLATIESASNQLNTGTNGRPLIPHPATAGAAVAPPGPLNDPRTKPSKPARKKKTLSSFLVSQDELSYHYHATPN